LHTYIPGQMVLTKETSFNLRYSNVSHNSRRGEITCTAMRHCLVLAGIRLTSPELNAVDQSFRSTARPEMIYWRDICKAAVDACNGGSTHGSSSAGGRECTLLMAQKDTTIVPIPGKQTFFGQPPTETALKTFCASRLPLDHSILRFQSRSLARRD